MSDRTYIIISDTTTPASSRAKSIDSESSSERQQLFCQEASQEQTTRQTVRRQREEIVITTQFDDHQEQQKADTTNVNQQQFASFPRFVPIMSKFSGLSLDFDTRVWARVTHDRRDKDHWQNISGRFINRICIECGVPYSAHQRRPDLQTEQQHAFGPPDVVKCYGCSLCAHGSCCDAVVGALSVACEARSFLCTLCKSDESQGKLDVWKPNPGAPPPKPSLAMFFMQRKRVENSS